MIPYVADPDFTLYNGDARGVLALLDDGAADCIVTSPPYYLLRDYDVAGQIGHEATLAGYIAALVDVFREARRVLADDGTCWINIGDVHASAPRGPRHGRTSRLSNPERQERVSPVVNKRGRAHGTKPKDLMLVPFELGRALRDDGWWLRQIVIWEKQNPIPESARDRPTTSHEYVLLLAKSRHYFYDADAIAEPATWDRWGAQTMTKPVVGKARIAKRATRDQIADTVVRATRNARSVWRIACAQFHGDHSAVMPDELARRCILAGTRKGGVVLDPFGGAGTTARVAREHGRRSVLIELSEKSCAIAARELQQQVLAEATG